MRVDLSHWDKNTAYELFGFSGWVTVMSLAQRCIFNIMPTVIAAIVGTFEVTVFSLAATLEGYVYSFADAINGMFLPKISRILAGDRAEKELALLMGQVGRFHVATIGLMFVGFLAVGRDFVALWMGDSYSAIYVCASLMILPSLIDVPQQVAKTALLAKNLVREQAIIYLFMAALNLAFSVVLVPGMGAIGAALSICVAYLFRTLTFNLLYRKYLLISLTAFFRNAYGRWIPVAALTLGVSVLFMNHLNIPMSWGGLAIKILLIAVIYLILFVCIGLENNDRRTIVERMHGWRK